MRLLPDKPSELIRVALADLRKAEASPDYLIDMRYWHQPTGKYCTVCLAGAVMAFSLGADSDADVGTEDFDCVRWRLVAINDFRTGDVDAGFMHLGIEDEDAAERLTRRIVPYKCANQETFHREMEALASDLEKEGY